MALYDRPIELRILSSVDEADPYEVDEAHIGVDAATGKFVLLTASGCSCWDGEYDEEVYDSLDALERALVTDDRRYNPTLMGARQLVAEARSLLAGERDIIPRQSHEVSR